MGNKKQNRWFSEIQSKIGVLNKRETFESLFAYMLNRTSRMFKYRGLPDTIPPYILEQYLQINGFAIFKEFKGDLYVYFGGLGGEPNEYYKSTVATIANPAQNLSGNFKIGTECAIVYNDSTYSGLVAMFNRYCDLLTENLLSLKKQYINSRKTAMILTATDAQKEGADKFLRDLENGIDSAVTDNNFVQGIQIQPLKGASNREFTELIEVYQFILGQWYGELGLETAFNLKREMIGNSESELTNNALTSLTNDMLLSRREGLETVNRLYGTSITVDFNSTWKEQQEQDRQTDNQTDNQTGNQTDNQSEDNTKRGGNDGQNN